MRKIFVIGIGAGDPDYLTVQAIRALNAVDVFFLFDKGEAKNDLIALRREICRRFIRGERYRFVAADSPDWSPAGPDYTAKVEGLNRDKQALYERLIRAELGADECGGVMVWGDPALYDSTVRILETIAAEGVLPLQFEVVPGISSLQALAARHKVPLNTIGGPVHVTTGRRLARGWPEACDSVVVMLDADLAARAYRDQPIDIYWGAYLGTPDEILIAGRLDAVIDAIAQARATARAAKGWIMDTYLLRRTA